MISLVCHMPLIRKNLPKPGNAKNTTVKVMASPQGLVSGLKVNPFINLFCRMPLVCSNLYNEGHAENTAAKIILKPTGLIFRSCS